MKAVILQDKGLFIDIRKLQYGIFKRRVAFHPHAFYHYRAEEGRNVEFRTFPRICMAVSALYGRIRVFVRITHADVLHRFESVRESAFREFSLQICDCCNDFAPRRGFHPYRSGVSAPDVEFQCMRESVRIDEQVQVPVGERAVDMYNEGIRLSEMILQRRGLGTSADQNRHGREENSGPVALQMVESGLQFVKRSCE